jgi:hypothetical protein
MPKHHPQRQQGNVIFRRYRRLKNGRVLDAHDYGIEAWPIPVRK